MIALKMPSLALLKLSVSSELTGAGTVAAKVCGLGPQPGSFHPDMQCKLETTGLSVHKAVKRTLLEEE